MTTTAYKGFDKNLQCRGFQFEVGKTYEHDGPVVACESGFHACENPLDVLTYYAPGSTRFAKVELSGEISRHEEDSKLAAGCIKIAAEIGMPVLIADAVAFVMSMVKASKDTQATTGAGANAATTGDWANAATTGAGANAATTGAGANAATTGAGANAATTGDRANAATTGDWANAATTGYRANAATTGEGANAATTGDWANAATTGAGANAATTGDWANAATTGYRANAATTGDWANAATTGNWANAATTGYRANAATTGAGAVACALGINCKAKAGANGAIVLCHRAGDGSLIHIRASKVGENGVKPDTWYALDAAGDFVEAA